MASYQEKPSTALSLKLATQCANAIEADHCNNIFLHTDTINPSDKCNMVTCPH